MSTHQSIPTTPTTPTTPADTPADMSADMSAAMSAAMPAAMPAGRVYPRIPVSKELRGDAPLILCVKSKGGGPRDTVLEALLNKKNLYRYLMDDYFTVRLSFPRSDGENDIYLLQVEYVQRGELYCLQLARRPVADTRYPSIHEAICAFMKGEGYPTEDVRPLTEDEFRAAEDVCMQEWAKIYPYDPIGNFDRLRWFGGI